jgi:hypothetical protein
MNRPLLLLVLATLALVEFLGVPAPVHADATAASVAMGGVHFRKEVRISMEKERLWISVDEIKVEYDFLNQTNADITTDVAFPLADRHCRPWMADSDEDLLGYKPQFQLWVDGAAQKYKTETQALVHKRIYTTLLRKLGIDVATCGHYQEGKTADFAQLSAHDVQRLSALGLLSPDGKMPQWTIRQIYYWTEAFPAQRTVHLMHTYKPGVGQSEQIAVKYLDRAERKKDHVDDPGDEAPFDDYALEESCLDPAVGRKLAHDWAGPDIEDASGYVFQWVDYILRTANNWQGPIKDFELNVQAEDYVWVNFCWDGAVERLAPNRVRVKAVNFSPSKDLRVVFLPYRSAPTPPEK